MKGQTYSRRTFLRGGAAAGIGSALWSCQSPPPVVKPPRDRSWQRATIILRSGWQTVNIGDIAHTPGVLRLLRQFYPDLNVILWSNALDRGVREMLARNFPKVRFISGRVEDSAEVRAAFKDAGFLLHGSGPSVVARNDLRAWRLLTGKPYGILGVTLGTELTGELKSILDGASFVYTRETKSLENLKAAVTGPVMGFAPDGTFALKIHDEEAAKAYMAAEGLEPKKFIAVVPRLRYTPYHKMRKVDWSEEKIRRRESVNEKYAESDHAKLREVITAWVRETDHKVLLCPEMTYQTDIIDPLLYDPLPADVKRRVVRRKDFWITDEASSVYRRAMAVVSYECHSPIIACANDTPAIYIHQPEDGIKGQMWKDVGMPGSYFEAETVTGAAITQHLRQFRDHYASVQTDTHEAVIYARKLQSDAMIVLGEKLAECCTQPKTGDQ